MPKPNIRKLYLPGGIYHVYNRGVNRDLVFRDAKDYDYFLRLLEFYLTTSDTLASQLMPHRRGRTKKQNLSHKTDLISYALMPNHFHLLIRQHTECGLTELLRGLSTSYSMYFNQRHGRTGHVFESIYKAVLIESDEQFLHVNRYIHKNPLALTDHLAQYPWSNYGAIVKGNNPGWQKYHLLLERFDGCHKRYREFVEQAA